MRPTHAEAIYRQLLLAIYVYEYYITKGWNMQGKKASRQDASAHSSKYFLTSTKIASATVFLVPGFGIRAISFATCTASGGRCSALSVWMSNAFSAGQPACEHILIVQRIMPGLCISLRWIEENIRKNEKLPQIIEGASFWRREWDSNSR